MKYIGPFCKYLTDYCNYKKSLGYKFETEEYKLLQFDKYTKANDINDLSLEMFYSYLNSLDISNNSRALHASILREFTKYLVKKEIIKYSIPDKLYRRDTRNTPHIFTDDEINSFFLTAKNFYSNDNYKNDLILLCFILLYCTGMRITECLNIRFKDINFTNNSITLFSTKNGEDRNIVVNDDIIDIIKKLKNNYFENDYDDFIFIRKNKVKYTKNDIYIFFRQILYYAGIKHDSRGPRLHSFRYIFIIRCYYKLQHLDEHTSYIAVLATYVGHKNFNSTEYYLKLTTDVFPEIIEKSNQYLNGVIRRIDNYEE